MKIKSKLNTSNLKVVTFRDVGVGDFFLDTFGSLWFKSNENMGAVVPNGAAIKLQEHWRISRIVDRVEIKLS